MRMTNPPAVVGVFRDQAQAEQAVQALKSAGFTDEQIGFLRREEQTAQEKSTDMATKVGAGVGGGGVLGGLLGATAALVIPGLGPALAGGILAATLGGAAIGALAGGIAGALISAGVPQQEARYYQDEFEAGRTLVLVKAENRLAEARDILYRYGAYDAATKK